MLPRSCKNKGQRASKEVKELLLKKFSGLEEDDITVVPSGVNGVDLLLSPKAQKIIPLDFEVKNQEKASIWQWLKQAKDNSSKGTPVVVFRRNGQKLHVCLEFEIFLDLVGGE